MQRRKMRHSPSAVYLAAVWPHLSQTGAGGDCRYRRAGRSQRRPMALERRAAGPFHPTWSATNSLNSTRPKESPPRTATHKALSRHEATRSSINWGRGARHQPTPHALPARPGAGRRGREPPAGRHYEPGRLPHRPHTLKLCETGRHRAGD